MARELKTDRVVEYLAQQLRLGRTESVDRALCGRDIGLHNLWAHLRYRGREALGPDEEAVIEALGRHFREHNRCWIACASPIPGHEPCECEERMRSA